jgi:hypothetical protein
MVQIEGDCMNLIMVSPTYGPVDPSAARALRIAVMNAAGNGHRWVSDVSTNRQSWTVARNTAVKETLKEHGDDPEAYMVWMDSDVIPPPYAITNLLAYGKDFVTGIYFQRTGKHWPVLANYKKDTDSFQWMAKWPKNIIAPIDGCGFGCCVTSIKMLKDIEPLWFEYKRFSEDFDFCLKAKKAGYQLYVDTGILCGHLKEPEPATIDDFIKTNPKIFETNPDGDTSSVA